MIFISIEKHVEHIFVKPLLNINTRLLQDRDITEKIALGQAAQGQAELYDQRLFNASSGLDSGTNYLLLRLGQRFLFCCVQIKNTVLATENTMNKFM